MPDLAQHIILALCLFSIVHSLYYLFVRIVMVPRAQIIDQSPNVFGTVQTTKRQCLPPRNEQCK